MYYDELHVYLRWRMVLSLSLSEGTIQSIYPWTGIASNLRYRDSLALGSGCTQWHIRSGHGIRRTHALIDSRRDLHQSRRIQNAEPELKW